MNYRKYTIKNVFLGFLIFTAFIQFPLLAQEEAVNHGPLFDHCKAQIIELCPVLIEILEELYKQAEFWKTQKLSPLSYFLSKDPTKWVNRKKAWESIDETLIILKNEQDHNAYYLGLFSHWLQKYNLMEKDQEELSKILNHLEQCLTHYPQKISYDCDIFKSNDIHKRLLYTEALLLNYKKNSYQALLNCTQPSHLQRNWLAYTVGGTTVIALAAFIALNKYKLEEWAMMSRDAVHKFWQERISDPVYNMLAHLFRKERTPIMIPEGVKASGDVLEESIRTYIKMYYPDYSVPLVEGIIEETKKGNMSFILQEEQMLKNVAMGINKDSYTLQDSVEEIVSLTMWTRFKILIDKYFFGRVGQIIYIQKAEYTHRGNKASLDGENIVKANALNIELLAFLPIGLLVGLTYYTSKTIMHALERKTTYQPLRHALYMLQKIYGKYSVIENNELSSLDQGYVTYWIVQFKNYAANISINDHVALLEDMQELESLTTARQKLMLIQRMYYNYHFLLPTKS